MPRARNPRLGFWVNARNFITVNSGITGFSNRVFRVFSRVFELFSRFSLELCRNEAPPWAPLTHGHFNHVTALRKSPAAYSFEKVEP
jgi:hypothetical protein